MAQLKRICWGGVTILAVTSLLCCSYYQWERFDIRRKASLPKPNSRATYFTPWALRDFQPGGEALDIDAPRPESIFEVAGVFYDRKAVITPDDAKLINRMPNLYVVALRDCVISREFWKSLDWTGIRYLYVDGSNVDNRDCEYIANANDLRYISCHGSKITKEGIAIIKEAIPKVSVNDWYY